MNEYPDRIYDGPEKWGANPDFWRIIDTNYTDSAESEIDERIAREVEYFNSLSGDENETSE